MNSFLVVSLRVNHLTLEAGGFVSVSVTSGVDVDVAGSLGVTDGVCLIVGALSFLPYHHHWCYYSVQVLVLPLYLLASESLVEN